MHRLRGEGLSVRQIAARLGLSRTKTHRWLIAGPEWDGDGDVFEEENLTPPFRFAGLDPEPRPGKPVRGGERYVDATGKPFNPLDLYRWGHHSDDPDRRRSHREAVADLDRH